LEGAFDGLAAKPGVHGIYSITFLNYRMYECRGGESNTAGKRPRS
jgi:hypothetical protein